MSRPDLLERAIELGVDLKTKPSDEIVVTGASMISGLGNTEETWQALLESRSAVEEFPQGRNDFVKIAAPLKYNPEEHFSKRELRGVSSVQATVIDVSRRTTKKADLLGEDGKLRPDVRRVDFGSWIGSGIGPTQHLIDVYLDLHGKDDTGDVEKNSRRISPVKGLEIFPEEINAAVTRDLGLSGWGGTSFEACATGLSNIVDAASLIRAGSIKGAIAGGFDDALEAYPEVGVAIFAGMRIVLSKRNNEPQKASRPFDKDRDGFVIGAGGGELILEDREHAERRKAPILARVLGFRKSMDGESPTNLNVDNVARTILQALWNERNGEFYQVDAIFAHATSTVEGDIAEAKVFRRVFGDEIKNIPVTAIKSCLGHQLGGAGGSNAVAAVYALKEGKIPPIANLENPDPEVSDLYLVKDRPLERLIKRVLVVAYGFGGYNAALVLENTEGLAT